MIGSAGETNPPKTLGGNRYTLSEWAGAFGDLGTFIPFVAAYVVVLGIDATCIFVCFGVALVVVGLTLRTPFPVQPMKAIGAVAVGQAAVSGVVTPAVVTAAALATGVIWLVLGLTGLARVAAQWVPRAALLGVVMGLGFTFMLEGLRLMASSPWIAGLLFVVTLGLNGRRNMPGMLVLLMLGIPVALVNDGQLGARLLAIRPEFKLPSPAWGALAWSDLWTGLVLLALPQLPLTFGNALLSITEENNRLFPMRRVGERQVAISTGLMNLGAGAFGGIPMCHGAGGMAGHVRFGARTGGSSVILGVILLGVGLFFAGSVDVLFAIFPRSVLGVILFLAGLELAMGSRDDAGEKVDRFIVLSTAALTTWNVGLAVLFGWAAHQAFRRGWFKP